MSIGGRGTSGRHATEPADEGRMTLVEHLRELRSRLLKAVIAVALASVLTWTFYDQLFHLISDPYTSVAADLRAHGVNVELAIIGSVVSPFLLQLKISAYAGIVLASPVWLYQVWAFVAPGLHRHERRYALAFLGVSVPLFLSGVALCYWALPKGIAILLEFTPTGFTTLTTLDAYLDFVLRMMLIFGIGFVLPVFVVLLNAMGVLPARVLARARSWVILGIFVFAAVATPTGDPFNMCLVAIPITVLYLAAEILCRFRDRRRDHSDGDFSDVPDDEASPLDPTPSPAPAASPTPSSTPAPEEVATRLDDEAT